MDMLKTDVLIVGAGPAGAATAAFLGRFGTRALMISRHRGTADTPRAHIVNQRTMEAMRDAGLEEECIAAGSPGTFLAHSFWLRSMAGEELARVWAWGNDPRRISDYLTASPCHVLDLPQTKMEPILVAEATRLGVQVRFGWELISFTQDSSGVTAQIVDRVTEAPITVHAQYMIGADGGRSRVVEQLGLPLKGRHGLAMLYNVLCEVDLSDYTVHRQGSLYWVIQPGSSAWGPVVVFRMVRPWDRWLVTLVVPDQFQGKEPANEDFAARIREAIGDGSPDIRVMSISKWYVNDVHAESLAIGRVLCMGDAVHRHPPAAALGSNTCVQDGFNLAWKLALVLQGKAHPRLLDSFDAERQPIARQIVERANKSMAHGYRMVDLFGGGTKTHLSEGDVTAISSTPEGRRRLREELSEARYNGHAHGVEMTRIYRSSAIVEDETSEEPTLRNPELFYEPSTRPGSALPHVWLVRRHRSPLISTLDLAGGGAFRLFSGHGGAAWRDAVTRVSADLRVEIGVTLVGDYLDYKDPYNDWWRVRGVEEDGCVLVRPDLIVGWRCARMPVDPGATLSVVMNRILGWHCGDA
jgi:2,4-dichlorophenol 6-monooxygenase